MFGNRSLAIQGAVCTVTTRQTFLKWLGAVFIPFAYVSYTFTVPPTFIRRLMTAAYHHPDDLLPFYWLLPTAYHLMGTVYWPLEWSALIRVGQTVEGRYTL